MPTDLLLPFDEPPADPLLRRDEAARAFAVDPSRNVVLEASAGTGKTRVLVTRYLNLLRAGVDPANILAITFTRKAAAEMRERIVRELRAMAGRSAADAARWRELRDRLGEIGISTIDAFCLSLLREFPLEADLDPGFQVADETQVPRLVDAALDAALRAGRRMACHDQDVALVLAGLGERRLRLGLGALLGRRLVTGPAFRRFLAHGASRVPADSLAETRARLVTLLESVPGGANRFIGDGPVHHPAYRLVEADLRAVLDAGADVPRAVFDRLADYFLTRTGEPRQRPAPGFRKADCPDADAWKRHAQGLTQLAPHVSDVLDALRRDLNQAMARGVERLFRIARRRYRRALEEEASVDFTEGLARTLALLRQMDEFAQSRYRLEARYHHVLVDEFQDTSGAQWTLVSRLVESWGEGMGLAHDSPLQPSVFVVGDRKQSIYGFRDADVRMLRRARKYIAALRPGGRVRRSIARSFRSAPALLAFTNDLFGSMDNTATRPDAFRYGAADRFPVHLATSVPSSGDALGVLAAPSPRDVAVLVAAEIDRILHTEPVRDRQTGLPRPARPGDVAILFRSRESHRDVERALEARGIPTYVYKGLGFFDADEVKDLVAVLRFLADPASDLRAAAFLRSRLVRLSDIAVRRLAPGFAAAVRSVGHTEAAGAAGERAAPVADSLPEEDARVLRHLQRVVPEWLSLVDRIPPAEVLDRVLADAAYAFELRGPRQVQARENVKKVRALLRRLQNRGYATMPNIADHLDRLSAGDESNAIIDAADAVNLMTVHAAKGLEFPIVFIVNLGRGTGTHSDPIVVSTGAGHQPLVSVGGGLPEVDEVLRSRDLEETKRLLYVAVTRARERLYLSGVVKDGQFKPGRGSLGEILPSSLREVLAQAASQAQGTRVEWQAPGGVVHAFRVCTASEPGAGAATAVDSGPAAPASDEERQDPAADTPFDFAPWRDPSEVRHVPVTVLAGPRADDTVRGQPPAAHERADRRLSGTLVHRLFQAFAGVPDLDLAVVEERARTLVTSDELAGAEDADEIVVRAATSFLEVRQRPDVTALLDSANCLYEVPFSFVDHGAPVGDDGTFRGRVVVRGTIDCLARRPDGSLVLVEIKTGRPHEWHQAQLTWYLKAVRALFPGQSVEGRIVYAEADATGSVPPASNWVNPPDERSERGGKGDSA